MEIRLDDLQGQAIRALLDEHVAEMYEISPPDSVHTLDIDALRKPDITFWSAWDREALLGCGALKELDSNNGEVKSMRTVATARGRGVAARILQTIVDESLRRGYCCLWLETGSQPDFKPAHRLYERHGFQLCEPFADYLEDPNSVFMRRPLRP